MAGREPSALVAVAKALERHAALRARLPPWTTAYRLLDSAAVTVDWFDAVAVLSLFDALRTEDEGALARSLVEGGARAVYVKRRPRQAHRLANEVLAALAPAQPLAGEPVERVEVLEGGLRFEILPANGLSVGLYLDARDLRALVRARAGGRAVLNTFAYSCGFGLAAQAGGARAVLNVDVSRRVLDWGERNALLNALSPGVQAYRAEDVFATLKRFARSGERFDLVVLDPPSFATTRQSRFSAGKDYPRLVEAAARVLAPGGALLALCNLLGLDRSRFVGWVRQGVAAADQKLALQEELSGAQVDFPVHRVRAGWFEVGR